MATNFVTQFRFPNDDTPVLETEVVTFDFIHEYIEHLAASLLESDKDSKAMGRWNWEYTLTKTFAKQVERYSRMRVVKDSDRFSGHMLYLVKITVDPVVYSNTNKKITDVILIEVLETLPKKVLYSGTLSGYKPQAQQED